MSYFTEQLKASNHFSKENINMSELETIRGNFNRKIGLENIRILRMPVGRVDTTLLEVE